MMRNTVAGGCLCGAVRYEIDAGPGSDVDPASLPATYCHCSMCRKATGGPFATFLAIPRGAVTWPAEQPTIYRSSPVAGRAFCSKCGSPLYYDKDDETTLALTVGSLDDPSVVKPDHHYGVEAKLAWVDAGDGLPGRETQERFEGQP